MYVSGIGPRILVMRMATDQGDEVTLANTSALWREHVGIGSRCIIDRALHTEPEQILGVRWVSKGRKKRKTTHKDTQNSSLKHILGTDVHEYI